MNIKEQALRNPETWQGALGLLPVLMYPWPIGDARYVLLNGTVGNFCLSASLQEAQPKVRANQAWSCNVGHYIAVRDNFVEVSRWDRPDKVDKYTVSSVVENLTAFHAYLADSPPAVSASIISHYARAFRRLRSATNEAAGATALNAFLYLVACADSNRTDLSDNELAQWDLTADGKSLASSLSAQDRDSLVANIAGFGTENSLQPDLGLVIRHASGAVFEDAHRIAEAPAQLWFDGMIPEAIVGSRDHSVGINFTPSSIARTLAEEAVSGIDVSRPELTALDPACGSAELLKEVIRILEKRGFGGTLRLRAFDISNIATAMARFTLAYEKRTSRAFNVEYSVTRADSLDVPWPVSDIVVMNPPFRRWNDLTTTQQQQIASVLGVTGTRANYAQAFLHKAATAVASAGVLASVAPNALFETAASRTTRALLAANLAPRLVARLGDQMLFRGSIVDAGLYVGVNHDLAAAPPAIALWADQNPSSAATALRALRRRFVTGDPGASDNHFSIYPDRIIGKTEKPWRARSRSAVERWAVAERNPKLNRASGYYNIHQGARMGDDAFIVEKSYVSRLPKAERAFFRPAVLNSSIDSGVLNDRFFVFFPHSPGLPELSTEQDLLRHVGTYAERYLLPKREKLRQRKHKTSQPKWWEMVWPRTWQFERQAKLVTKYFGGAGSFAWDKSGDFVVVVGHAWIQKEDSNLRVDLAEPFAIATAVYLNLPETEDLIDYLSIRVAGGQLDLSSRYLNHLLIPNPRKLDQSLLEQIRLLAEDNPTDSHAQDLLRSNLRV